MWEIFLDRFQTYADEIDDSFAINETDHIITIVDTDDDIATLTHYIKHKVDGGLPIDVGNVTCTLHITSTVAPDDYEDA